MISHRRLEQSEDGVRMVKYIRRDKDADAPRRVDGALDIVLHLMSVLADCVDSPVGYALLLARGTSKHASVRLTEDRCKLTMN